jgi:hypothetical protein
LPALTLTKEMAFSPPWGSILVSPFHSQSGVLMVVIVNINGIPFVKNSHCFLALCLAAHDSPFACMPVAVMKSEEELHKDGLDI